MWVGLGRVEMCQAFQTATILQRLVVMSISILLAFFAIKGPAKKLRLSLMSGEKYVNKLFLLFSGCVSAIFRVCHRNKWSNCVNYRST